MVSIDPVLPASSEDELPADRAHHARAPRSRTCLKGKLAYGDGIFLPDGAFTLDCTVRNISEGGARITLARHQSLPPHLYLIAVKHAVAYEAKIVWQKFPSRGLSFLKTFPLAVALPPELEFLRRLWKELSERSGVA